MHRIIIIVFSFSIFSCATNKSSESITFVNPESPGWCQYEGKCRYIFNVYCYKHMKLNLEEECFDYMKKRAGKYGVDTIVLQENFSLHKYGLGYDRTVYGQAYDCNGKYKEDDKIFVYRAELQKADTVKLLTKKYANQCGAVQTCEKGFDSVSCDTRRHRPTARCFRKLRDVYTRNSPANTLVVKNQKYSAKTSRYEVEMSTYVCK